MAIDRPTFHEAWYRVAELRPRLLSGVRVYRQYFRGQLWYVLENPTNGQYSRVSEEAYRFIGLLDGRRTVAETIRLLGQLHGMNILYVELPVDSEALFERYRKRVRREVQGYLTNLLFVRIPLLDPNRFLDRWVSVFGWIFSVVGLALWVALLGTGLYFVVGNIGVLLDRSADVLDPDNAVFLYLSFVLIKVFHEFNHAFACKKFGRLNGNGGEVHKMGVMFLVFFPLPYVDASTAWAFQNKWHRAIVGMAGVMAELAAAAIAAIVWANTSTGTPHIIAYNVIFVASVSTLLFNGNPLLRFDAYYVLTDIIEIPNLGQRSRQYLYYLVKRYVWGLKRSWNPAYTSGERIWFVFYGIASVSYRIFISIRILLFLNNRLPETLFILVPLLAFSAIVAWVLVPLGKFLRYLATDAELTRHRFRAVASTVGIVLGLSCLLGIVRWPDYCRVEGVVEPSQLSKVHAEADGFISAFLPSQTQVAPEGPPLIEAHNFQLEAESRSLDAQRRALEIRRRQALVTEVAAAQILAAQILDEQLTALAEKIRRVKEQLSSLHLAAPASGMWVSTEIEDSKGRYVRRGEELVVIEQASREVEIRAAGRPDPTIEGTIEKIFPAGQEELPSEALGYVGGGSMPVDVRDPRGMKTAEKFFEIRIRPRLGDATEWFTGQRVVVRIRLRSKPLAAQLWHYGRQLFQRRFHI